MILQRDSVELLAPAGNREALEAAVEAGADAVYLGGKHFNMRLHRQDMNFTNEALAEAIQYTHRHRVRLYVTINNLISEKELPELEEFLSFLDTIRPDAILVQDMAVIELVHRLGVHIPLHASVMMNIHNAPAMRLLKEHGVTRIVASREMTLAELTLLRQETGLELEYFIHGDMCIAESGQCYHSGVLFGQSSNRGRCLKPCRWPYRLLDETTGEYESDGNPGPYKLALKDMCLYRDLPALIQSGVYSFKIEGRMRPPEFVRRIVSTYRRAIDAYIADPAGYMTDEAAWRDLYENRARDFTTSFAFGQPDARAIGYDGQREPRFFSKAKPEAGLDKAPAVSGTGSSDGGYRTLAVRVADIDSLLAACDNGADVVYVGGETYRPRRPWTLADLRRAKDLAREFGVRIVVSTPRSTRHRLVGEMEQFFYEMERLHPAGLLLGNPGSLKLAAEQTCLPLQTDFSFNVFNHLAARFWKQYRVSLSTLSLELSLPQMKAILQDEAPPLEVIVHGAYESMICDHDIPALSQGYTVDDHHYALVDETGARHPIRRDQHGRDHIFFTRDLCLYPYLAALEGAACYRVEAQTYSPALTGKVTRLYRRALNALADSNFAADTEALAALEKESPRPFGIGAFLFDASK